MKYLIYYSHVISKYHSFPSAGIVDMDLILFVNNLELKFFNVLLSNIYILHY